MGEIFGTPCFEWISLILTKKWCHLVYQCLTQCPKLIKQYCGTILLKHTRSQRSNSTLKFQKYLIPSWKIFKNRHPDPLSEPIGTVMTSLSGNENAGLSDRHGSRFKQVRRLVHSHRWRHPKRNENKKVVSFSQQKKWRNFVLLKQWKKQARILTNIYFENLPHLSSS